MATLEMKHTIVLQKKLEAYRSEKRFIISQGGSRSSKTYSIMQLLLTIAMTEKGRIISIVRKSFPTLRGSVYREFIMMMKEYGVYDVKKHNKTENIISFDSGSMIEFFSVDDEQKLRGRKRDILYCNEANELTYEEFMQLNMRTSSKIILDYNPSDNEHWIYNLIEDDKSILIKSTFRDNPFLPASQVQEYEDLIKVDYNYYRIYALGERPENNVRIYNHFKSCNELPEGTSFWGLDFGFNDPTALIECRRVDGVYYVRERLYKSHLTTTDLINFLKDEGIRGTIWADSSRPEAIQEILLAGFDIRKANKAIKDGIMTVKSKEIYITTDSVNLLRESKRYSWKTRGETILDEPIDLDNHGADALRYALHSNEPKADINDFISTHKIDMNYQKINY